MYSHFSQVFSHCNDVIVVIRCTVLATSDIRSKKCTRDGSIKSFFAPVIHQAASDTVAHCAVYCSILERISEVAKYRGENIFSGVHATHAQTHRKCHLAKGDSHGVLDPYRPGQH